MNFFFSHYDSILIASAILLVLRFIFKFLVQPYLMMRGLKKLKGAYFDYTPLFGILFESKKCLITHHDFFYAAKKRMSSHPELRFTASPFLDKLTIVLLDPLLIKDFVAKQYKSFGKDTRMLGVLPPEFKNGIF